MAADRSYVAQNDAARARLQGLVARCSDAMLASAMPGGWTVAGVLSHVAFWDQRIVTLLEAWRHAGVDAVPAAFDEAHVDWINDAAKPMFLALAPRRAADLAVQIAEQVDAMVAALPDEFVERNQAAGKPLNLRRAEHRREHLDEIDTALGR
jgi:uncharacterized damage-inducible protein DinB